ncbi:MAG: hypothetical protein AUJ97_05460 [Bacteroidetes bacterium CG2_30_32_10]|nr:MAG: hypothetical protein AUJ97_05460 [Bacteroidetes bacterium CG2_30_32_10]
MILNSYNQNSNEALDSLQKLLSYYQSIDSNGVTVSNTLLLLENETKGANPYLCLSYGQLAIRIAEKRGDKNSVAGHCNVVGGVFFSQKQYYSAMQYYFKGYKTMVETGKEDSTGYYLIDIGNCFFADNNNKIPIKYFRKSATIFIKVKNDYGAAVALNNIGLVKNRLGEQDSALYYFNLALSFRQRLNDSFLIAHSYRYFGDTYLKMQEYDKAYYYLNLARNIILKTEKNNYDKKRFFSEIYQSIALLNEVQQKYEKAIANYQLAIHADTLFLNDKFAISVIMQKIAHCYLLTKQYDLALSFAQQALKQIESSSSLNEIRNCDYLLVQIYSKLNNEQKEDEYLTLFMQTTDSLINQQSDGKFTGLRISVETFQKEKELAIQHILLEKTKAEIKNRELQRNILIAGFILVILFIIALYIAYRNKYKTNKILLDKNIQISQQKEELEVTASFKQQFLANMSHEIRTPMTGIVGMIDFLEKTNLDEKQKEYIEILRNSSEVLLMIINDILDLSKIEAGKMELRPIVFSTKALIRKIQLLFSSLVEKKELQLKFQLANNLPDFIEADEMRLMEVITNLISNAVKFTEKGTITVKLEIASAEVNNIKVKIEIADTGIGISKTDQAFLFNVFTQLNAAPTLKKGSGLGLSICRKLVELMGGEINVESDGKNGSSFWFTLLAKAINTNIINEKMSKEKIEHTNISNLSVLLVEDKMINQKVLEMMFQQFGCKTTIASNGLIALAQIEKTKFDLIFMDIQMPVMDGITAVKELRKQHQSLPPIIALSANVLEGFNEQYIAEGMDDCLAKPVKLEDIEKTINKWCPPIV